MPNVSAPASKPIPIPPGALRVVLFGMPAAGKSSLLGALAQAAQTQEHVLAGHLLDPTRGLTDLQHQVYETQPEQTLDEVVPYPVVYEPTGPAPSGERLDAVLIDSDGRVANELLAHPRPLDSSGPLAQAVQGADALVLPVDASAEPAQMDADFGQFTRFLRLLEQDRGQRTEVGGLPVYLVLTKCDLLAQTGESPTAWIDAVEVKKQEVGQRFRDFLARAQADRPLPFGSIDLHVEATAIKRPALAGSLARPQEPFGVAELFRDCLEGAEEFHKRRGWSNRRLFLTVAGSALLLAAMVLLGGVLLVNRQSHSPSTLQLDVNRYLAAEQEQNAAARHRNIAKKVEELTAFESNPDSARLPPELQEEVHKRLEEARAYQAFERALNETPDPATVTSEEKLNQVEKSLVQLHVDVRTRGYWADWSETDAGRQYIGWMDDVDALSKALRSTKQGYRAVIEAGNDVIRKKNEADLPGRARKVLERADELPTPATDRDRLIPGSRRITFAAVFGFKNVVQLRNQWEEVRKELERYRS